MFSFFSWRVDKVHELHGLSRKIVPVCLALCLLWAVVAGCDSGTVGGDDGINVPEAPSALRGSWAASYGDHYEITATTLTYHSESEPTDQYYYCDEGTIRSVIIFDSTSGVIIVEYTASEYGDPAKPFNATYYRNLTATTVEMGTAVTLSDYSPSGTATLAEAETKFTLGNAGDFIGQWGSYTK